MNAYLRRAPWWTLSVLHGFYFAAVMAVLWPIIGPGDSSEPMAVFVVAIVSGLIFGAIMGPLSARQWASLAAVVGPLSDNDFRTVSRAAWRGPIPTDDAIRVPALAMATWRASRTRPTVILALAVLELALALSYAVQAPDHTAQTVLFGGMSALFFWNYWYALRLRRRVELLKLGGRVHS
ncbi:hypothetical protein [Antrihabitans sp. YC2-6]|uniref:hypothetical protein n=1 Tax=Antrihabitans sp. YC2-6 TaxID=2799498 RepID=UPI0018F3D78C|nr:hypothetical protein [Antrihabitans sp. YC2-6]MBJ8345478.1 hypothetical protein [Antrihabitans sp. YC2-6]